ncbi:MAG: hypothetical protein Q9M12_06915, partial [Mariprofundus sp.]|nr:hypothetical protein [Mariprofundus sp.]
MSRFNAAKVLLVFVLSLLPSTSFGAIAWTKIGPKIANATITSLAINSRNQNILYSSTEATVVGAVSGVYKTTNGGKTWALTSLRKDVGTLIVDPNNPNILYAAPYTPRHTLNGGLFKSVDAGATWVNIDIINLTF